MKFTDDNLKQLKEQLIDPKLRQWRDMADRTNIDGLIARMEASEELADALRSLLACTQDDFDASDGDGYILKELVKEKEEAWRKARGI